MLKLVFSGEIIQGFERDQVIEKLALLLKQTPDTINKNLFAGRPVVVKRVESDVIADKWIKTFAKAGALLQAMPVSEEQIIDSAPVNAPLDEVAGKNLQASIQTPLVVGAKTDTSHSAAPKRGLSRRRQKVFLVLGVVCFVVIAALISMLWITRPLWQSPDFGQQQQAVVNALASEEIYALGHINFNHIQSLEALAQREADLASLPGLDEGLWASLEQAGIRVREQVQDVWVAGYIIPQTSELQSRGPSAPQGDVLLVLSGEFNSAQVSKWLKQRYLVESENADGFTVAWLDEHTCEKQPAKQVVVTSGRILVGSPARVTAFQQRLQTDAKATPDLTNWNAISSKQLASLAVFVPKNLGPAVGGLPGHLLKEAAASAEPATGFFLGLDSVSLPPGVELSLVMTSEDPGFLSEAHTGFTKKLAEARNKAAQSWPETLPLYDRLMVEKTQKQLRASVRFDENLQQELSNWMSAFFSANFASSDISEEPQEEELDENPPLFSNVDSTNFPNFSESQDLDSQFRPVAVAGPLGIELRHLEMSEEGPGIALDVRAFNLPNIESLRPGLTMHIIDVLDRAGNSLAPTPKCGPDKIREPVEIGSVFQTKDFVDGKEIPYTQISGSTIIRLPATVSLNDVDAITGVFNYQLPRTIETLELKAPLAGQVIEKFGLRLRFLESSEGSVRYEYSGNVRALLHVAGLNVDGQPLARDTSLRSGMLFGSGHAVSASYKGIVSGVQIHLASDIAELSYPFRVVGLQPAAGDNTWPLKAQPKTITDSEWDALRTDTPPQGIKFWRDPKSMHKAGPVLLAIQDLSFNEHFGLQMDVETYISNRHPFASVLGGLEVAVTEIIQSSGEVETVDLRAQFPLDYDGGYWTAEKFMPNESSPWLRGKAQLRDAEIKITDVKSLRGSVSLHRAQAIEPVHLPATLGAEWSNEKFTLRLVRWEKGRLIFSVAGDISSLVSIQAVDASGAVVSQPTDQNWMFGAAELNLDVQAVPQQLVLLVAEKTETLSYPFEAIQAE